MILICYDGSADAEAAADRAHELFSDRSLTVLTVWESYLDTIAHAGLGLAYVPPDDPEDVDAEIERNAARTAGEGAQHLRRAGATVEAITESRSRSVAATILEVARRVDAEAIVVGTRGRGGLKSALLGSVSHAIVQHADRPVLVVPSDEVARTRTA